MTIESRPLIAFILLLLFLLWYRRSTKATVPLSISSVTGEQVFRSDGGLSINQGQQSVSITSSSIIYSVSSSELMRITPVGIGIGTTSPNSLLHVDGTGIVGISIGNLSSPSTYVGITGRLGINPATPNSQFTGIVWGQPASTGYLAFYTRDILLSSERMRLDSTGHLMIGTTTPSNLLTVNGAIIQTSPTQLNLYGTPSLTNLITAGSFIGSIYVNTSTGSYPYQYGVFPSSNTTNWTPSYVTSMFGGPIATGISIPYSGLYSIRFTYETTQVGSTELFISKNMAYPIVNYQANNSYTTPYSARYIVLTNPTSPIMCWSDLSVYSTSDSTKLAITNVFQNGLVSTSDLPSQLVDGDPYSFAYVSQATPYPRIIVDLGSVKPISKIVLTNTTNPNDPPLGNFNTGTIVSLYNPLTECYAPGEWFQYQISISQTVSSYSLAFTGISAVSFSLLGSADGSTWTMLDIQTGVSLVANTLTNFPITARSFPYYRLVLNQLYNGTGFQIQSFLLRNSSGYVIPVLTSNSQAVSSITYTLTSSIPSSSMLSQTITGASSYLNGEWIQQYQSTGFILKSFSLSSLVGVNVLQVSLLASNNGFTWSTLLSNQTVNSGNSVNTMVSYPVTNTVSYTYYRLVLSSLTRSTYQLSIGCWSLFDGSGIRYPSTNLDPTKGFPQTVSSTNYTLSSSFVSPLVATTPVAKPFPYLYSYPNCLAVWTYNNASVYSTTQNGYLITAPYVLYSGSSGVYAGPVYSTIYPTNSTSTTPVTTTPALYLLTRQTFTTPLSCVSLPYQVIVNYGSAITAVQSGSFFYNGTTLTGNTTSTFTSPSLPDKTAATRFSVLNRSALTVYPSYTILLGTPTTTSSVSTFGDLAPDNESLSNENLLASGSIPPYQTGTTSSATITATTYLSAGEYVNLGLFSSKVTAVGNPTARSSASLTLLQRTA